MNDLTHQQLQKGLEVITKTAKAINAKQVELIAVTEEVSKLLDLEALLRKEVNLLTSERTKCHEDIITAERVIKEKNESIQRLDAEEIEANFFKSKTLNLATSAYNSVEELNKAKDEIQKHIDRLDAEHERASVKTKEVQGALSKLENIKSALERNIAQMQASIEEADEKFEKVKRDTENYKNSLDNYKYTLNNYASKLQRHFDNSNIVIKIPIYGENT